MSSEPTPPKASDAPTERVAAAPPPAAPPPADPPPAAPPPGIATPGASAWRGAPRGGGLSRGLLGAIAAGAVVLALLCCGAGFAAGLAASQFGRNDGGYSHRNEPHERGGPRGDDGWGERRRNGPPERPGPRFPTNPAPPTPSAPGPLPASPSAAPSPTV
ncbi:MAG TPA: hypothetical protein VK453_06295 [Micromonosporaceae bacterium]|nr:hypothetical protein [Micromonosporaceae bacterium]